MAIPPNLAPDALLPRATLERILEDLGPTLLELVYGDANHAGQITGMVIHDSIDAPELPTNALVLGVGLHDGHDIAKLLTELGREQAVALVLRAAVSRADVIAAASAESGVAVLGLTQGASWAQLAAMLRSMLDDSAVGPTGAETLGGIPSGDLFTLANAIAELVDAPITIEDRNLRVLAYSGRQDEADQSRIETILGRRVPEQCARMLTDAGVFRELYRSEQSVWADPLPLRSDEQGRVAIAVRAGDEVLGSIWVATAQPLSKERVGALQDAAKLVALHLLHVRAGADVQRRLRAELVSTALEGGIGVREALSRLRLADQPIVVLVLAIGDSDSGGRSEAAVASERQRLSDAFSVHLSAIRPRSATAVLGEVVYGLLPIGSNTDDGEERAARIADDFLRRTGSREHAVIGIGPVARTAADLARSRATADRVLRVLRSTPGRARRVARLVDVDVEALLLDLHDLALARGDSPTGAIAHLMAHDQRHAGVLVGTLRAWLDTFGDVPAAAARMHVHPNTFRYRLRRLAEIGKIDLADTDARFAAMLQIRLIDNSAPPPDDQLDSPRAEPL